MKRRALIVLIVLLILIGSGLYTYARYQSSWSGNGTVSVAKWAVSLTDGDSTLSSNFDLDIDFDANSKVASGYIAPGSSGTATLILDLTDTQVAVNYSIEIDDSDLPNGIEITSVTAAKGPDSPSTLSESNGVFSGSMSVSEVDSKQTVTFEINIEWDNSDESARIESDTEAGEYAEALTIPITVTVRQQV